MFGYVRPRKDELKLRDYDTYHAAYCGLCRAMGKTYGFRARMLVNYDMTFLYLLRSALQLPGESRRCFCPANPLRRKQCACDEAAFAPVTAYNVILCYEKLNDVILDSGFFRSLAPRIGRRLLKRAYKKAARLQPSFARLTTQKLSELHTLESSQSDSIDATADTFASIVAGCAADYEDPAIRRPMQTVLYQVGRFLYLADAMDDLSEDCHKNRYNPLRYRFHPEDGALTDTDSEYLRQLTDTSVNIAGSALSLLPLKCHSELLENIIFLGLPAVFTAVLRKTFRPRDRI